MNKVIKTMNMKSVLVSLILGISIFIFGAGLGMLYQMQKVVGQPQNSGQIIKDLSSKVIPTIYANGTVAKIDGRRVTLSYQQDSLMIPIRSDAKIYSAINPQTASQPIDFGAIKVGDNLGVNVKLLPDGTIEGGAVVVLPPLQNHIAQ